LQVSGPILRAEAKKSHEIITEKSSPKGRVNQLKAPSTILQHAGAFLQGMSKSMFVSV